MCTQPQRSERWRELESSHGVAPTLPHRALTRAIAVAVEPETFQSGRRGVSSAHSERGDRDPLLSVRGSTPRASLPLGAVHGFAIAILLLSAEGEVGIQPHGDSTRSTQPASRRLTYLREVVALRCTHARMGDRRSRECTSPAQQSDACKHHHPCRPGDQHMCPHPALVLALGRSLARKAFSSYPLGDAPGPTARATHAGERRP